MIHDSKLYALSLAAIGSVRDPLSGVKLRAFQGITPTMWAKPRIAMTSSANSGFALDPAEWQTVNDDVMGGVSTSRVRAVPGGLRFEGVLVLDFGGGFASARRDYALPAGTSEAAVAGFALSVRGDGKCYRLTLFTRSDATGFREPYHYQAQFETTGADQAIQLPLAHFAARLRGHSVAAPPVAPRRIVALGLQISDRQEGPFALEVRSIEPIVAG